MKLVAVAVAALVLAAPAAAKQDPQLAALKRQVAQLQRDVKALRAALKAETNHRVCDYALDQDTFRTAVFPALDHFAIYLTGSGVPAWETIPRFDDQGTCAAVGISRP